MTFRHPSGGLPVSSTVPNEQTWIEGLPYNVPFTPPVQLSQTMQPYLMMVTGYVLSELQNNATKTQPRTFLYNLLSQNYFQNEQFIELLSSTAQYAEYLGAIENLAVEQAIAKAAFEMASIMTSVQTQRYPQLMNTLPQGGQQSVEQWLGHYSQVTAAVESFQRQQGGWAQPATAQPGFARNQPQQTQWGGQVQQVPHGAQWQRGSQWTQQPQQPEASWQRGTPAHHATLAQGGQQGNAASLFQHGGQQPAPQSRGTSMRGSLKPRNRTVVDDMDNYEAPQKPAASQGFPNWASNNPPAPTQEPVPRAATTNDGTEIVLASQSNWKRTFTLDKPYRIAYDPQKEVKFHARDQDGVVKEFLMELDDTMNYDEHELNPTFRHKTRLDEHGPKVAPNWDLLGERMKTLPEVDEDGAEIETEGTGDVDPGKDPLVLPEVLYSHSLDQAKFQLELSLLNRGVEMRPEELPYEFYYHHVTPYLKTGDNAKNLQEILLILKQTDSLAAFVENLGELHGHIPDDCWHLIHQRATVKFNEILATHVQIEGWEVSSIVDDWAEVEQEMVKDFGEEQGNALFKTLCIKGKDDIIAASVNVLAGEALDEYIATIPERYRDVHPELNERLVAMAETCSVTHVPWNAADLSIKLDKEGGAVLESKLPGLYAAIKGLMIRTEASGLRFRHRYIVTNDNVKLEIFEGYLGKGWYLIKEA